MKEKSIYSTAAFSVVLLWALWNYQVSLGIISDIIDVIMPFIIGAAIAFIVNVLLEKIELFWCGLFRRSNRVAGCLQRPVCLLISFLLIGAVAAFVLLLVVPEIHSSLKMLAAMLPAAMGKFNIYLQQKIASWNLSQDDIQYIQQQWLALYKEVLAFLNANKETLFRGTWHAATSFFYMTADLVIGFVFAVYVLLEKDFLCRNAKRALYAFCTKENAVYVAEAAAAAKRIFSDFVAGQLLEALILGLLCFAGMLLLGLPYALVTSVLVAAMALIPILGTFISAGVGCFLTLVAEPDKVWWFILFFFVLQRIEGDFLYPRIVGRAVGLSELFVLAAITIGGSIGGIVGIIISVPLCSVAAFLLEKKVGELLSKKNIQDI